MWSMVQRQKNFLVRLLPYPHGILHRRVSASVPVLITQSLEYANGSVTLLSGGVLVCPENLELAVVFMGKSEILFAAGDKLGISEPTPAGRPPGLRFGLRSLA